MMTKRTLMRKRAARMRSKLRKTSNLRLSAFRSLKHIYVQVIDDENGKTILSASSHDNKLKGQKSNPKEVAFKVGEIVGEMIKEKKIKEKLTFDRGGYLYHGRIKELAMGIRSKGIKF